MTTGNPDLQTMGFIPHTTLYALKAQVYWERVPSRASVTRSAGTPAPNGVTRHTATILVTVTSFFKCVGMYSALALSAKLADVAGGTGTRRRGG